MDHARLTAVLLHGAGHTAEVWRRTRAAMAHRSLAVNLPGRADRPADITTVTVEAAAASIAADVTAAVDGDVVLVAHSVAGTVAPAVTARLGGRVRHLVFVAGIAAPDGERPIDVFLPGRAAEVAERLGELRRDHGGQTLEAMDIATASSIDSLNFSSQTMPWGGVPESTGRSFVRCLRDPIQPRAMQDRFIAHCAATEVIDLDSGHTPAIDAPLELAAILDRVLDAVPRRSVAR